LYIVLLLFIFSAFLFKQLKTTTYATELVRVLRSASIPFRERRVESGELRVESGEWRVESGEWRVESGEWRVESG
jgi:hypothetical protein